MTAHLPVADPSWYITLIQGTTAIPKSVAKLIDTVGGQIGLFLEPIHLRRKGQAEIDVAVAETRGMAEIAVLCLQNKLAIQDIQDRADERVRKREAKRQSNIEAITAQAVQELPGEVSEKPVDEDWISQFFNYCQDVSNDQMQSIWARLLAGEVAMPGSFSLRTTSLVRGMSKNDANMFTRFCALVWKTPGGLYNSYHSKPGGSDIACRSTTEIHGFCPLGFSRLDKIRGDFWVRPKIRYSPC